MLSPFQILSDLSLRSGRPVAVTFQVTERCNYDCVHCFQDHGGHDELTTAEIERILSEIADAGVLFLTLMGGEYFMRPDADHILAVARELGFRVTLKSTGHHIHDRRADLIASLGTIAVELSLYAADAHKHEQVTEQAGSWRRTVAAARRLVDRGVPVTLNCPVMEATAAEVVDLEALAADIGAKLSCDGFITPKTSGDHSPTQLRMRWDTLRAFFADHRTRVGRELAASHVHPSARGALDSTPCGAGSRGVGITPRGKVWPCMSLAVDCGDLREQSFADVWAHSPRLAALRDTTWAALGECARCALRPFCHRCHATALTEHGAMLGPSLEACRQAVVRRDILREQGLLPPSATELPPTWERVDRDGAHSFRCRGDSGRAQRSSQLRVLP